LLKKQEIPRRTNACYASPKLSEGQEKQTTTEEGKPLNCFYAKEAAKRDLKSVLKRKFVEKKKKA